MCSTMSTPGSRALEVSRTMGELETFKKPTGIAKRSKAKILEEETYIKKMGKIIERDFFPDLEKLRAQNAYLDAVEQNDTKRMRELYAKYSSGQVISERIASPATFETPLHNVDTETADKEPPTPTPSQCSSTTEEERKISLDEFLNNNTSEDNASFEDMIAQAEKRHRLKYSWLYEAEEKMKQLKGPENLAIEDKGTMKPIDTWGYKNMNYIMYIPEGVELTNEEKIEMAKKKQEVVHDNTRLKANPFNEVENKEVISELAKSQAKIHDGKIGVDGKEVVQNPVGTLNGFSFVATPSPMPGVCESPLMTWGQIEGTPFRLDGGDTPLTTSTQRSFRMAEPSKREKILMQLTEKAGEKNRDRKHKALEVARRSLASPSPRSAIDRLNTMSPAARRLATQKLGIHVTPSPRRHSNSKTPLSARTPYTPRLVNPTGGTPSLSSRKKEPACETVSTDNLLNLPPKRQRASDFF